ncbi:MAG TPA: molybdopterin-dependent oxidoreductase [Pirellulales bacterium]|jgi:DMSO/TMAO reductase YedYZ molybdopterin-dependent catalytic subunit|nr:molybdopterin-dependent oxidoreductase [Pirellulales bacterium]
MRPFDDFLARHRDLTRRYFLKLGVLGLAMPTVLRGAGQAQAATGGSLLPNAEEKAKRFGSYLTPDELFADVSRGQPLPHELSDEKKSQVGMTRDTWRLEVISDPDHPVKLRKPLTKKDNTALDFKDLLALGEKHAVRFPKIMTCLNLGCPLGMGIWEGVPLREVVWLTQPREDTRRVFFYGYHNDDPKQIFRSSLPIGRVMEDYFNLPPVILCYKLNGQWLSSTRGGPVRVMVPEAYGFKNVKWLSHVVLTNLFHANDTYAEQGNDIDSPMKTFAATIAAPRKVKAAEPFGLTGYAQVGVSGIRGVQVSAEPQGTTRQDDPYFITAPWRDMEILAAPEAWGGGLPDDKIPSGTHGFDSQSGRPLAWPMQFCAAHWAGVHPGLPTGKYNFRCRAIDANGLAQPMPRPFRKSGSNAIEQFTLEVTDA